MKRFTGYITGILLIACIGCSDWLDVNPRMEVREEQQFDSEEGFKNVLTGIYMQLASQQLYGQYLTMSYTELMAQHWKADENTVNGSFQTFDFKQVESEILRMWNAYYQSIANLNLILKNIEGAENLFLNGNYQLIKGEALALRAFLHFELLRLWGPSPTVAADNDLAIPYVTEMTKDVDKLVSVSYAQVLKKVMEDIEAAEKLLANEPAVEYCYKAFISPASYQSEPSPEDEFQLYRQNRFNYYALKALKARVYLWQGIKDKALENAQAVIDAIDTDGGKKFTLTTGSQLGIGKVTFPQEQIFTLYKQTLSDIVQAVFQSNQGLEQDKNKLEIAYEVSVSPDDIRYAKNRFWEEKSLNSSSTVRNFFLKYDEVNTVPVIRLAEMYLIAMECSSLSDAAKLFTDYRISRNMDASIDRGFAGPVELDERLEKEYRKEFYGEGQMFFYYKRKGVTAFTWPQQTNMEIADYQLPKPKEQSMFE